jgi:NAD(P)-dependent dehydrogenase (short-subunit alcohol dehydrogenase family)
MKRFENTNIVVTGAASGIGQASAIRFAEEGGNLALLDLNTAGLEKTAEQCRKHGVKVFTYACDVTNHEQVVQQIDKAAEDLGGFTVLAHIAGALKTYNTHEMAVEDWHRIIAINLHGTFYVNQAALKHLLANRRSVIVNMASTAAIGKHPWMSAYAAAKGGVISFTRSLYIEYVKKGLRANCLVGGGFMTGLHSEFRMPEGGDPQLLAGAMPIGKMASPEHAASVIAFLASDDARYINGTEIRADGGALS